MAGSRGRPRHPDVLTPAEWQVADLVRHGVSRSEIARLRGTSVDAVKYHLINIRDKIGVAGMAELRHWTGTPRASAVHQSARRDGNVSGSTELAGVGQIALVVKDIGETERFYRDVLGLTHLYTFGDLVFVECGSTRLFLRAVRAEEWAPGSIVYFRVDDLHATYARLQDAGVDFQGAPHLIHRHEDGTEEWMAFFADPAGNILALMSQLAPAAPA